MNLRELSQEEVLKLELPDHCTQVQVWNSDKVSVIKSVDDGQMHVSVCGLWLPKAMRLIEEMFPDFKYKVGKDDGPVIHFWEDK